MTLPEILAETRFIRWIVHSIVWPIGCALGFHFYPMWPMKITEEGRSCPRCGKPINLSRNLSDEQNKALQDAWLKSKRSKYES